MRCESISGFLCFRVNKACRKTPCQLADLQDVMRTWGPIALFCGTRRWRAWKSYTCIIIICGYLYNKCFAIVREENRKIITDEDENRARPKNKNKKNAWSVYIGFIAAAIVIALTRKYYIIIIHLTIYNT